MRITIYYIQAFILLLCSSVFAQKENYRFINFGAKDGLQDKVVYNAAQDKKGYMWFATATGLYRYDGHHFKYYRSSIDKAGSNVANVLQAIMCDDEGNLWLGSLTTLQWFNPAKNIFWQPDMNKAGNKQAASSYFYNFSKGKYTWCSTAKNFVYRFNKKDSSFLSLAPNYPTGASTTSLNTVELGAYLYDIHPEGIYVFDLNGKFVNSAVHPAGDITNASYVASENAIYLPTYTSGMLKYDINTKKITDAFPSAATLKTNYLFSITNDDEGNYYTGATSLFIIKPGTQEVLDFYSKDVKNEFDFNVSKIVNIFIDREKNKWFCSHNGLSMMPWQNSQVKTILLKDEKTGFTTEAFGAYEEPFSKDILLINTTIRGIQTVNAKTGQVNTVTINSEPNPALRISGLLVAPDSTVYASGDNYFFKYNHKDRLFVPYSLKDQDGKPIRNAGRNLSDNAGKIFIASNNNGFYIWHYSTNRLVHYNKWDIIKTDSAAKDNKIHPCITDSKQNIWFTGSNGIYEYRQNENKYYHHTPPGNAEVPVMGESQYIAEDKNGHIWVATINNGLYELYFDRGNEVWKNYTVNSGIGLPADYIRKIKLNPADSSLWLSNTAGLLKFDPVHKQVISVLSVQNGLFAEGGGYSFNIFSDNRMVQLYYGAANILDFNTYKLNAFSPAVQFNSVKVLNEEKLFSLETGKQILSIRHNQNFLQFEFAALVFNNANQNQYAYLLEGADKNWIYSRQVNTASYSGLKPGTYTFKVKAANNDGLWGNETVLKIIISPPFYARWWFIALCGLVVGYVVYTWNRLKVGQAKKEEKLKASFQQQIAETEMKALRAQMNPHFIFNSLNSIQKYILKNEHFEASQYLTKFSRLIRLILDHSNQNTVLLSSELEMLKLYIEMESLRFDNKFDYTITTADDLQPDTVEIPSMLIQPYVENAIWHGLLHKESKGKLTLSFNTDTGNKLIVTVEDNGIGREKAAELKSKQVLKKKSYGMQITEDRIAIINRIQNIHATAEVIDLKDEDGKASGTKVMLHIPLKPLTA
jgi:ligand-binding sensor domain-containing protein/two-component sensor histidine kinase